MAARRETSLQDSELFAPGLVGCLRAEHVTVFPPSLQVPDSRTLRKRAEECRTLAECFRYQEPRLKLLKVAADYDVMAAQAEDWEMEERLLSRSA
jgi:hypothetical protein